MNNLTAIEKEIKCDEKGRGFVTISGLARLAGVSRQAAARVFSTRNQKYDSSLKSKGLSATKGEVYIPDMAAAEYIAAKAIRGGL